MTVHDGRDPIAALETQLSGAVDKDCRPQLFAAIRNRMAQGTGPSFAVLGGLMRKSGTGGISDALHVFNRSTSELLIHYNGQAEAQFSHRPGIFRFESMLRMRRMLMTQIESLMTQRSPDIAFMARQVGEIRNVLSMMGGVPVGFGLQHLFAGMRVATSRFAESRMGHGSDALHFLQKGIDNLQAEWPLEDPMPEYLSDDFIEEIFFSTGNDRSAQMAMLLDIVKHSDQLLRDPTAIIGRALEKEWKSVDAYLLDQFSNHYGERYMPEHLDRVDRAKLDFVGAVNYENSWKSYRIMWEMLRALGRQGGKARAVLPKMVKRFVFLTSVLSSYGAMLNRGMSLHSGKGRMVQSLKDMPEFEEFIVLADAMQAIDPKIVAGNVLRELREWLHNTDMSPEDRGYAIWRLQGVVSQDDIEVLVGDSSQRGIVPYVPQGFVDPSDCSLSDYIYSRREGQEFRELVSVVRDLSSTAEESAKAIEQLGLRGGQAAAGLLKEIVLSAPPQLVPRGDAPATIVPSTEFMGNTHYWEVVTPAVIGAMGNLGVDVPRSIISTANFSYVRTETREYGTDNKG